MNNYRLSLDLGANSIGWCVLRLGNDGRPIDVVDLGVRIFPDGRNPKDRTSLALARREARSARRRRDRYLKRRSRFINALIRHGLLPSDLDHRRAMVKADPYELRSRGLHEPLTANELGRALFHLNQRRGFQSNRKTDRRADDAGKIHTAVQATRAAFVESGARTVGEYLWRRRQHQHPVRARLSGRGASAGYVLYVDRAMIAEEFDALWSAQKRHHAELLSEDAYQELRDTLLFQRSLHPVRPGRCTFEPADYRLPWASPLAQQFRLLSELNHLRVVEVDMSERPLTLDERDQLLTFLDQRMKATFPQLRKELGLSRHQRFSIEAAGRKHLLGNQLNAVLGSRKYLGDYWLALSVDKQEQLAELLREEPDPFRLHNRLVAECNLTPTQAEAVAEIILPEGYAQLGSTALREIVTALKKAVIPYDKAVAAAGYHHSQFYDGEIHDQLPYYGEVLERHVGGGSNDPLDPEEFRYGRLPNPTVHIALNQLRKLVNELIRVYGHPQQVAVEVTRELRQSERQRREWQRQQSENEARNVALDEKLRSLGLPCNYENRLRLKLWEELNPEEVLDRRCPYSGSQISIAMLFTPEVEIEHILPFTRTLDNSIANKTLSIRSANKYKGNRTPFEAFGHSPSIYIWTDIVSRAAKMPANKRWRFFDDPMSRYAEDGDFLARHLNDTAYISRLAREYLIAVCPPNQVWTTPGRLTSLLRHQWGLNSLLSDADRKNRSDHRHHAIDAVVVGLSDRGLMQRIAEAAGRFESQGTSRVIEKLPEPWPSFRETVKQDLASCVVSHKPDHGVQAALHNETAYGLVDGPDQKGKYEVVYRKPLLSLKPADLPRVRDTKLRELLLEATKSRTGRDLAAALQEFSDREGVQRVRVTEQLTVVPIAAGGQPYKGYKPDGNYCYEVVEKGGRWTGRVVSTFEANQPLYQAFMAHRARYLRNSFDGEPLVMRLCKEDIVLIEEDGRHRVMRVVKFSQGSIVLAEHYEAGSLKQRDADPNDPFKYLNRSPEGLRNLKARRVFVDFLGRVKDPARSPRCLEESSKSVSEDVT